MFGEFYTNNQHRNISAALKRLNSKYPNIAAIKNIGDCVELRIISHATSRALMYKIDEDLPEEVKAAIKATMTDQAKKLRMEIITQ